jgi:hypothetical protein
MAAIALPKGYIWSIAFMKDEYYNSAAARLDTVVGRNAYWLRLKSVKVEYHNMLAYSPDGPILPSFKNYLRDVYGVGMDADEQGYTLPTYTIVDEQKHLIFLLKHSK